MSSTGSTSSNFTEINDHRVYWQHTNGNEVSSRNIITSTVRTGMSLEEFRNRVRQVPLNANIQPAGHFYPPAPAAVAYTAPTAAATVYTAPATIVQYTVPLNVVSAVPTPVAYAVPTAAGYMSLNRPAHMTHCAHMPVAHHAHMERPALMNHPAHRDYPAPPVEEQHYPPPRHADQGYNNQGNNRIPNNPPPPLMNEADEAISNLITNVKTFHDMLVKMRQNLPQEEGRNQMVAEVKQEGSEEMYREEMKSEEMESEEMMDGDEKEDNESYSADDECDE